MSGTSRYIWRDNALSWISDNSTQLPWAVPTDWRPAEATEEARFFVINVLLTASAELPPTRISVTDDRGVLIEWRIGSRELNVEVLPNAMLGVSTWESAELIEHADVTTEAVWRLSRYFAWLSFAE